MPLADLTPENEAQAAATAAIDVMRAPSAPVSRNSGSRASAPTLNRFLRAQSVNAARHVLALRPFRREEFGTGPAAPTEAHIRVVNGLLTSLRKGLIQLVRQVGATYRAASREPRTAALHSVLIAKERASHQVRAIERIWDFYFELFGQRQSQFGDWLLSCDRIALDCYQTLYLGLGAARPIPAPPPFSYMRTGFSPATFRRGIPLRRLGQQINPFPLIQLPYHRLVNPWTLGAVLHEVSHNFQDELGMTRAIPRRIARTLLQAGASRPVAAVWAGWNREMFSDLSGLLLGGPAVVASLMDVVGRAPALTLAFQPGARHPTPYLRTLISIELLRRMGFADEAERFRRAWTRLYPNPRAGSIPRSVLDSSPEAIARVVDAVCFKPFEELGGKSLAQAIRFDKKEQQMIEEAARRIAAGTDPGIIPERFLIGASRFALDHRLAKPGVIAENFYKELARR